MNPAAGRLFALLAALLAATAAAQSLERAAGVIGFLPLPEVFGTTPCARYASRDVAIYAAPNARESIGRIYVAQPWRFPREGGCEGLLVRAGPAHPPAADAELPTIEFGYEQPGAIVLRRRHDWFEIVLGAGTGWVRVPDSTRFLPVERLLQESLAYLRKGAAIPLRSQPGASHAAADQDVRTTTDLPVALLGFQRIGDALWVNVETLPVDPCTQERNTAMPLSGWLPFHDGERLPSVWFRSRGC